jgi:hypothetical protein
VNLAPVKEEAAVEAEPVSAQVAGRVGVNGHTESCLTRLQATQGKSAC